ncbi:hypothetical protein [Pseudanabaena sp. lw0831]|uniref:hypothetical protein n=1 Tax=Pseudanabaena sp. lw0831 TaxID=1357935 RepID=UPI001915EAB7|nr:hypothetical protein [Pseudanabaena sp. lw0831]
MQPLVETPQSLPKQPIATKAIVWVLFLLWTILLSGITWEIQHSCAPIIAWSDTLPTNCHPQKDNNTAQRSLIPNWLTHNDLTSFKPQDSSVLASRDRPNRDIINPNTIGVVSGTAVAIVSAIAGAPAFLTVGIGVAMWFFVKFFIKAASVS